MKKPTASKASNSTEDIQKKQKNNKALSYGMVVGIVIGIGAGIATDNIALWLPLGVLFGIAIGIGMQSKTK